MEDVNSALNSFQRNVYQKERTALNNENSENYQELRQTLGSQASVLAEHTRSLQQSGREREEQTLLENLKSSIRTCSIKSAEETRKLIMSAEEQNKQIQNFLKVQNSREKNVTEAKDQNEAMGLELHISRRNVQELESQ
jgi:hypothetical protein